MASSLIGRGRWISEGIIITNARGSILTNDSPKISFSNVSGHTTEVLSHKGFLMSSWILREKKMLSPKTSIEDKRSHFGL